MSIILVGDSCNINANVSACSFETGVPYEAKIVDIFEMDKSSFSNGNQSDYREYAATHVLKNLKTKAVCYRTEGVTMNFNGNSKVLQILTAILGAKVTRKSLPHDEKGHLLFDPDKLLNMPYVITFLYTVDGKVQIDTRTPLKSPSQITDQECKKFIVEPWALRRKKDDSLEELDSTINVLEALQSLADGKGLPSPTSSDPETLELLKDFEDNEEEAVSAAEEAEGVAEEVEEVASTSVENNDTTPVEKEDDDVYNLIKNEESVQDTQDEEDPDIEDLLNPTDFDEI